MDAAEKIKIIIDAALDGPLPKALIGVADTANGRIDLIARLAYIAGMKRALEILDEHEQDLRDEEAEKAFIKSIKPDQLTEAARLLRKSK